ncbi:hypothetical protein, partial [Nodularia spumigena]|uniref:hypothetical protein n=1 Tax=Nodularia spumigena TaxID=70799 RepID=UPI001E60E67D
GELIAPLKIRLWTLQNPRPFRAREYQIPPLSEERGFLNASLGCPIKIVLPSLDVRLKSPNALWRLYLF